MQARQTERFQATLAELAEHAEAQGFEARGGFYAWERLKLLVHRLQAAYDYYELEGDLAPTRQELDAYMADLADKDLRPDAWVASRLGQLLTELAPAPAIRVEVQVAWPGELLAVRPEALAALLEDRKRTRHPLPGT